TSPKCHRPLPRGALTVSGTAKRIHHRVVGCSGVAKDPPTTCVNEDSRRLRQQLEAVAAPAEFGQHSHVEDRSLRVTLPSCRFIGEEHGQHEPNCVALVVPRESPPTVGCFEFTRGKGEQFDRCARGSKSANCKAVRLVE